MSSSILASSHLHKPPREIPKAPTGIRGLDEIMEGGLPRGRPTLVCGGPGSGKTLLAMEFLVRGAAEHDEPGVFVSFEERPPDLIANTRSLGFDVAGLVKKKRLAIEHIQVERSEIEENGEYDLEGLFIILGQAVDEIGAKRMALDTIESLFSGLSNHAILRAELRRLFHWCKERGLTVVITGERGDGTLTRHGLEEYVSDCVISLDQRTHEQITTRRLRIVKYRGSRHGSNEYPFLIGDEGIDVMPITSMRLDHHASTTRVPTGVAGLDEMLGGKGLYKGASVLVSGAAGTGKSTIAASVAAAACERGERALYYAFEESPSQIIRNMASVGLDLQRHVDKKLLWFHAERPTAVGLELHLGNMLRAIRDSKPSVVIVDPVSAFDGAGDPTDVRRMLMRIIDHLKASGITAVFISLTDEEGADRTRHGVSSLFDAWLIVREVESNGERNRILLVRKSRGTAHSNQVREFRLTSEGIHLEPVYVGPSGVLTGSARATLEATERAQAQATAIEATRHERAIEARRQETEAQIAALRSTFEVFEAQERSTVEELKVRKAGLEKAYADVGRARARSGRNGHAKAPRGRSA